MPPNGKSCWFPVGYWGEDRVHENPAILISTIRAHCTELSASGGGVLAPELALRSYHFDPSFLWVPSVARGMVFRWARNVHVAQLASTTQPFLHLSDDCAGDVLEFLPMTMPRTESPHMVAHCSSPEAQAWVRAVLAVVALEVANTVSLLTSSVYFSDPDNVHTFVSFTLSSSFSLVCW